MEPTGIARSAEAAGPTSIVSAAGKVSARARSSMPAAADVTAATDVTTAAACMTSASAAVLRQYRCRNDHRPQNSGCQKKAPTLGIHDNHLQLPAPPLRGHFETLSHQTYQTYRI
jgi:hypothetical protein